MNFIGFLYFENKLKSDTPEVIQKLRKANLLLKVISGDNPLTTIECARKAGIIKQEDNNKPIVVFDKIDEQEFKITNLY
jgi:cation-transporting ATPase 13A3/4/5